MPDEAVQKTTLKVVQQNAFFAHQENVLIAMLGDNNEEIRMRGVNKVLSIRGNLPSTVSFDNHDLVDSRSEEYSLKEQNIMIPPQLYGCLNCPHWI